MAKLSFFSQIFLKLWAESDSNRHGGLPRRILSAVRLPIPPFALELRLIIIACFAL